MWEVNNSEYIYKSRWLTVRKDSICTDKGVNIDDFYVLEYPTWVNVVAKTEDGNYIVERQYRHGLERDAYEICAGVCEEGEDPLSAAQRELLEETGFGGGQWSLIGKFAPNSNSMNNLCYSFLAEGVTKLQEPKQEPTEDIMVLQVNNAELLKLMKDNQIVEGVMLAPLWQHLYDRK